jgi:hypothetical protein
VWEDIFEEDNKEIIRSRKSNKDRRLGPFSYDHCLSDHKKKDQKTKQKSNDPRNTTQITKVKQKKPH